MITRIAPLALIAFGLATPCLAAPISKPSLKMLVQEHAELMGEENLADNVYRLDAKLENGLHYSIRAFNCDDDLNCTGIMFFSTFEMGAQPTIADYEKINHYNDTYPLGRAFILTTEGYTQGYIVGIDLVTSLDAPDVLSYADFDRFDTVLQSFIDHMSEQN